MTGTDRNDAVELIARETAFQGHFRVERWRLRHRLFGGGWSREIAREVFDRGEAAAILLYDPDRDAVVLVEQFRVGALAAGHPAWLTEIVAGIVDPGETPEDVVRREAAEEAGCTVLEVVPVTRFLPSPGGCSEVIHLFCGRVDSRGAGGLHGLADENEDIRVIVLAADDAIARLDREGYGNGVIELSLHWLARHRAALRERWGGGSPAEGSSK